MNRTARTFAVLGVGFAIATAFVYFKNKTNARVREIGFRYYMVTIHIEDGWFDTGIPVISNRVISVKPDAEGFSWGVRIGGAGFYGKDAEDIYMSEEQSIPGQGSIRVPPEFTSTLWMRNMNSSRFSETVYIKIGELKCPKSDLSSDKHSHEGAEGWEYKQMRRIGEEGW